MDQLSFLDFGDFGEDINAVIAASEPKKPATKKKTSKEKDSTKKKAEKAVLYKLPVTVVGTFGTVTVTGDAENISNLDLAKKLIEEYSLLQFKMEKWGFVADENQTEEGTRLIAV